MRTVQHYPDILMMDIASVGLLLAGAAGVAVAAASKRPAYLSGAAPLLLTGFLVGGLADAAYDERPPLNRKKA